MSLNPTWIFLAVDCPSGVVPSEGSSCHSICTEPLPLVCWLLSNQDKFAFFGHFPSVDRESRKQRSTHKISTGPKTEWDIFIAPFSGGRVWAVRPCDFCELKQKPGETSVASLTPSVQMDKPSSLVKNYQSFDRKKNDMLIVGLLDYWIESFWG